MNLKETYFNLRKVVFDPLAWYLSKRELASLSKKAGTCVDELYEAIERYTGRGFYASIRATQAEGEFKSLARLVQKKSPEVILEIGTFKGGTLFMWCRSNPSIKKAISIDLPDGRFGGGYDRRRAKLYKAFLRDRPNAEMFLIRDDSHKVETVQKVRSLLNGRGVDFLFIDGDHTCDGVRKDFELYWPFVNKGGVVAFHDIITEGKGHEVIRFWNEIKPQFSSKEFVDHPKGGKYGIGVIFKEQ